MSNKKDFESLTLKKFKVSSMSSDSTVLLNGRRRSGKCLAKGTEIMMYNGVLRKVEEISVGDLVMGDDSKPRTVLSTHNGIDQMYKVTNRRGDSYTVNSEHILSLIYSRKKSLVDNEKLDRYLIKWFNNKKCGLNQKIFSYKEKDKDIVYFEAKEFFDKLKDDRKIDIPINEYLQLSEGMKKAMMGYQVPIDFNEKEVPIDPYLIGYWLGDGTAANSDITSQDSTVLKYFAKTLPKYNLFLEFKRILAYKISSGFRNQKNNIFLETLKKLNLINNKHIPMIYKCNSRENRLRLLAGFIDADGHLDKNNDFEITQCKKHEKLMDDIIYLARSLGFSATKRIKKTSWTHKGEKKFGEAFRIHINGEGIENIPTLIPRKRALPRLCNRDALVSNIRVTPHEVGEYYGIELDGNHRYILSNFIVTHNSFLVRDIFYHHRHIPKGVIFSGTEEASPFFSDFVPDIFIHSEYDPDLIETVLLKQKKKIRESKMTGKSDTGKTEDNNFFIVLDDLLHDANNWKREKTIKNIFFNGRHFNLFFILTMQYPLGITPELRSNIDYVFIFNEPSLKNRKKLYDDYCSVIPSFDFFCNILDSCTQNHECLVVKLSGTTNDIRDQLFWYKAEPHKNFRVGHPKFWKFHKENYNEHYESENEEQDEKIYDFKQKMGKQRKLKVFVNQEGKIVDHDTTESE